MAQSSAPDVVDPDRSPTWQTVVPVVVAVTLVVGVAYTGLWLLRDLLALGVWFLGGQ